jgi:DNA-binding NtrC family response regulator
LEQLKNGSGAVFTILCIDDEPETIEYLDLIKPSGCLIIPVLGEKDFFKIVGTRLIDLVMLDVEFCNGRGLRLLTDILRLIHPVPLVIHSRLVATDVIVRCLRHGAADYLQKPIPAAHLINTIGQMRLNSLKCRRFLSDVDVLLGDSRLQENARLLLDRLGKAGSACFLSGESGTGVPRLARLLHERLVSEIGERGRTVIDRFFTYSPKGRDAVTQKRELFGDWPFPGGQGLLCATDCGSIFIDDIEALDPVLQRDLSTIIESGWYNGRPWKNRLILGSRYPLGELTPSGGVTEDLHRILSSASINLPALRERSAELPSLVWYVIERHCRENAGKKIRRIGAGVLEFLSAQDWPGNLRDLCDCVETACHRCQSEILELRHVQMAAFTSKYENPGQ